MRWVIPPIWSRNCAEEEQVATHSELEQHNLLILLFNVFFFLLAKGKGISECSFILKPTEIRSTGSLIRTKQNKCRGTRNTRR